MSDLSGQIIGSYQIEALLGSGGMGRVFRAHHIRLDRQVALKLMHGSLANDQVFQTRFLHEARAIAALRHPHIIGIYDSVADEQNGYVYLVMELAEQGSLRAWQDQQVRTRTGWSLLTVIDLVRQAAEALAHAHTQGMIHRDIKPDNLLLTTAPTPAGLPLVLKIADFGLAHLADNERITGNELVGTPAYMSPEQCQGATLDARSDIYALGVVLYEVTVGRRPFVSHSAVGSIYKHLAESPSRPSQLRPELPMTLEQIILCCLAKRADERFTSADELAVALRQVLVETPDIMIQPISEAVATAPSRFRPRIYVMDDEGRTLQVVELHGSTSSVGRAASNGLVLEGVGVSRHHLRLTWEGAQISVIDLGSNHGTFLDGIRLPPSEPHTWPLDTYLQVGAYWLRLEWETLSTLGTPCD